ncbi:MAG: phosphoribosyl-AMP cyclohydrolase [Pseudomonadota bacterium]
MTLISDAEMADARTMWGNGLVAISKAFDSSGIDAATVVANQVLDDCYAYELGPVLFKPTMASGDQTFRPTRDGGLSYFVGNNQDYPQDHGFGLRGWQKVESQTAAVFTEGDIGLWMGNVRFYDQSGGITVVDKTWGYKRDRDGTLRIVLHHSSLPFEPSPVD